MIRFIPCVVGGACRHRAFGLITAAVLMVMTTACGDARLTQAQLTQAYQEALAATRGDARSDWQADPDGLKAAINRLQIYFSEVTRPRVQELTAAVYALDAYLCDTLHIARGSAAIEAYFVKTAERVNSMRVTILDYTTNGREVYARWSMTIAADELADGAPVTTFGLSHFRFNPAGQVILHQDFWDASAGFFEHLPGIGWSIPRLRGRM